MKCVATGLILLCVAASAAAQSEAPRKRGRDPNRIVCEVQGEVGSRLAQKKICKTAAEWAEERRGNRDWLQKVQTGRGCTKDGC